jgi:hypothetical protein
MLLLALTPETSDFLTVWGFVATIAGTLVGILGFGYTIYQVLKVKAAAEAAEAAAINVLAESKQAFTRFVGTNASRLLSELQRAVNESDWKLATIRANDLAEVLGTIPRERERIVGLVAKLRVHGQKFADGSAASPPKFQQKKWTDLLTELHALLDELRAPFPEEQHGEATTSTARPDVPGTRSEPPQPNAGEGSQLGQG